VLAQYQQPQGNEQFATVAEIADRRVAAECDDRSFFVEFFIMFGGPPPVPGRADRNADLHLSIRTRAHPELGYFRITDSSATPFDGREFSFALNEERIFSQVKGADDDWLTVVFRDSESLAFAFRGNDCLFGLDSPWRKSINWFALWRLLRIRSDAIFFHASSVGIGGEGTIFVGPKGGGKSTTSLALAARGHNLLSDETAGYRPATGELIPFRRPVGIKPGPRCSAVSRGLDSATAAAIERDGFARVDVNSLFPAAAPRPVPLRRIVFLRGFREHPDIARIEPGRAEVAELQPLMGSFLNTSHSQRVFELVRLLSTTKVYRLYPGDPDATAEYLEEVFGNE
jgi:hypothetical protein